MNGDQHDDLTPKSMNAADIIRKIDSAYAEMNTNVFSAARDAEEARKNARVASAVVRRYTSASHAPPLPELSSPSSISPTGTHGNTFRQPQIKHRPPPPPPPPPPPRTPAIQKPINAEGLDGSGSISYENLLHDKRPVELVPRTPIGSYTPTERISRSSAEDMLAISLELERTKQSLEHEKTIHEDTKSALEQSEEKNSKLQNEIDNLLNALETQRQNHGLAMESLERDLEKSRRRVQAAEEDAQLALELAKGNSESREQVEAWLQRALYEIDTLREHILITDGKRDDSSNGPAKATRSPGVEALHHAPKSIYKSHQRVVRFADDDAPLEMVETPSRPSRQLVAAGRQILRRSLGSPNDNSSSSPVHRVIPPELSADRLRQLRSRLAGLSISRPLPPLPPRLGPMRKEEIVAKVQALDVCRNTARVLRESGKRLQLIGKFFDERSSDVADDMHLETLARQYCAAVELSMGHQKNEIEELVSLVSLWEKSLPSDTGS